MTAPDTADDAELMARSIVRDLICTGLANASMWNLAVRSTIAATIRRERGIPPKEPA